MKKNIVKIFASALVIATAFTACSKKQAVTNDFEKAKMLAANSKKDIIVFVTADGDDKSSTQLISNVLENSSFKTIEDKYVVAHLDFSYKTYNKTVISEDASEKEKKEAAAFSDVVYRNSQFATQLNVAETPAAYLVTKEPYVISTINFDAENPGFDDFNSALEAAAQKAVYFHEQLAITENGSDEEKISAIESIINATEVDFLVMLGDKVQTLINLDSENELGLLSKYLQLDAKIQASKFMSRMDTINASSLFENLAKSEFLSPEEKQDSYYNAAYVLTFSSSPDLSKIISLLSAAIEEAPESAAVANLKEIKANLSELLENTAN